MAMATKLSLSISLLLTLSFSVSLSTPPLPILPLPTASQLSWQQGEMALFLHFGPNTFTDSEWGTGQADPSVFYPISLNTGQWAEAAAQAGFSRLVLTAKHHDGFCLWPSSYTNYSVKSSDWMNGTGDVVKDLAQSAKQFGLGLGLYLSPWDRHESCYGNTLRYNEYYLSQMTELLTRYGEISEVWLDGAKGEGEKNMDYYFDTWFKVIHQLQPKAVIFSDDGPDSRWVGDEDGEAGSTNWSLVNRSSISIGHTIEQYSQEGDPKGQDWLPAECDVSIRPGWFWHRSQSPKNATDLLEIYYKSVGRNCLLILNVPPNTSGLISHKDLQVLKHFKKIHTKIFSKNLAQNSSVSANSVRGELFNASNVLKEGLYSYWAPEEGVKEWELNFDLGSVVSFNVLLVQEPIQMGQRVGWFYLEAVLDGEFKMVGNGTTIGYKRLLRFGKIEARFLRLVVEESRAEPLICYFGLFLDKYSKSFGLEEELGGKLEMRSGGFVRRRWRHRHGDLFGGSAEM